MSEYSRVAEMYIIDYCEIAGPMICLLRSKNLFLGHCEEIHRRTCKLDDESIERSS